jgi:hypothetical protein
MKCLALILTIASGLFIFASDAFAADACNNPYFSLDAGDEIHYKSLDDNHSFKTIVTESKSGFATIKYDIFSQTFQGYSHQHLSCKNLTIQTDDFIDTTGGHYDFITEQVTGPILPSDVQLGSSWSTTYEITQAIKDGEYFFTVQLDNCVVAEKRITVPAGTYNTFKVRVTGSKTLEGSKNPPEIIRQDIYWAKGVGIIKIVDKSGDEDIETVASYINVGNWKETTANIAAPTAVGLAAANTAIATQGILSVDFGRYLWFFITEPLLFIRRRKRRAWGTVYNSLTRLPEDLVIVRAKNKAGKIISSQVTDKNGRFSFLVPEGEYKLSASKANFRFPSAIVKGKKNAGYLDIYLGDTIKVGAKGTLINNNIPLDPTKKDADDKQLIKHDYWHAVQEWVALAGPIVGIVAFALNPNIYIGAMMVGGLFIYLFFRRFAVTAPPKKWGLVREQSGKAAIERAVVRIFVQPYNKLAEYKVTDSRGRYHMLAGNCKYYLTVTKPGYEKLKTKDHDTSHAKEPKVVTENLSLKKQ